MSTATLSPPTVTRARVDRAAGIIRRVKLCGTSSKKGRVYSPGVLREALPLYENAPVYVDHADPGARRKLSEKFGVIRGVFQGADGSLYGDLHYNRAHPMAGQILESAEFSPDQLGMSHNASGPTRREGDHEVVTRISGVSSVDIVPCPATNNSLFESEGLGESVDSGAPSTPPRPATAPSFLHRPSEADCVKFIRNIRGTSRY